MITHRYLFLDIDGVLNSSIYHNRVTFLRNAKWPEINGVPVRLEPSKIPLLNQLVHPSVQIVLSSMWRVKGHAQVESWLRHLGFTGRLVDATALDITDPRRCRGKEIAAWLKAAGHEERDWGGAVRFACLDDDRRMEPVRPHWVPVDSVDGLTGNDVEKALKLLALDKV